MGEYWNTARTARMVVDACEDLGVDTAPILTEAGIDRSVVDDPEGRVSLEQMSVFWQQAVAQSGDPAIGLRAGLRAPHGLYGLLDYIYAYSATVGEALTRFSEYLPLINNWAFMRPEESGDHVTLVIGVIWGAVPRTTAEYITAALIERGRRLWDIEWAPLVVRYEFAAPGADEEPGEHARWLKSGVEFGASRTELIFDRATWDRPVRTADAGLVALLEVQAAQLIGLVPRSGGLVENVQREIRAAFAGGDQRIEAVAFQLDMSARTLQRRLSEDGLTFASIVDEVRLDGAKLALADLSMSLADVGYFVGFEEQSSFSRAFKRWTGDSPKNYRMKLTAGSRSDWPDDIADSF